ncbi:MULTISPECIES: hypothetical protein [Bacillus cereus group]|nr:MULTISPECIES: hypothetical protein [Bacillus cereus group]MDA2661422.1 hypothetical protein [Bacillus cereus]
MLILTNLPKEFAFLNRVKSDNTAVGYSQKLMSIGGRTQIF